VAGDVAMLAHEVTPVPKALRSHGLDVMAIHQHMTTTQPMIFFLHYWGAGRRINWLQVSKQRWTNEPRTTKCMNASHL